MGERVEADLYGVLGAARDATAGEIRRAYRRLARRHHPDLNPHPDGAQRFAAVTHAYEILNDPARRARYNHTLAPSPRRGILELSPQESAHVAYRPVVLRDVQGQTIVLPAGTGHGDQVTVLRDGHPAALTVRLAGKR